MSGLLVGAVARYKILRQMDVFQHFIENLRVQIQGRVACLEPSRHPYRSSHSLSEKTVLPEQRLARPVFGAVDYLFKVTTRDANLWSREAVSQPRPTGFRGKRAKPPQLPYGSVQHHDILSERVI